MARSLACCLILVALVGCPRPGPAPPTTTTTAPPTTTVPAPPPTAVPASAPSWHVSYPTSDPHLLEVGCSGAAVCVRLADLAASTCPAVIQVPRGCTPGAYCPPEARAQLVDAPLVVAVSTRESAAGPACCYDEPSRCVPPNAGRRSTAPGRSSG